MGKVISPWSNAGAHTPSRKSVRGSHWIAGAAMLVAGLGGCFGQDVVSAARPLLGTTALLEFTNHSAPLIGQAVVVDGDTMEISGERVRLNGIDAPEFAQTCKDKMDRLYHCGAAAAQALSRYIAESIPVRCAFVDQDQYGRVVGDCVRADGQSIARWMVRNGHALEREQFSGGAFKQDQDQAKAERLGIWKGSFEKPWEWRSSFDDSLTDRSPAVSLIRSKEATNCDIKGNVAQDGERIYHLPGQNFYNRTVISTSHGERWFCSEAAARQAGWRRSKR